MWVNALILALGKFACQSMVGLGTTGEETMNDLLSEQLRNLDLIKRDVVNTSCVARLSLGAILDLADESLALTSSEQMTKDHRPHSHTASLSLSGERWPCSSLECRLRRIQQAAYFAALFSDGLYMRNFLGNYAHVSFHERTQSINTVRKMLHDDIVLFLQIEPLVRKGIIRLVSPPNFCPKCLSPRGILTPNENETFKRTARMLLDRYLTETTLTLSRHSKRFELQIRGPTELVHDGEQYHITPHPPPSIERFPGVIARVKRGEAVELGRKVRSSIRFDSHLVNMLMGSVVFEYSCSQCLDTGYVSDNPLELSIIKGVREEPNSAAREDALLSALTCEIPFLSGLRPQDLVHMRERDGASYQLFRKALTDAVGEVISTRKSISKKDARQLYEDIVAPELARLDLTVKAARNKALKSVGTKVLGWTAAIGVSAYAGLLPISLAAAAGALGFTQVLADLLSESMSGGISTEDIRNDKMFFLWRVKKEAERKGQPAH